MARLFGTDGVRGVANSELTAEFALDLGKATVSVLSRDTTAKAKILIGKDTRISSDMLEAAIAAGICSMGADVVMLGFIPTPAVAYLITLYNADAGIVVSASHNPMEFNGIKVLGSMGFKLTDEQEDEIEESIKKKDFSIPKVGKEIGSISFLTNAANDYIEHLVGSVEGSLEGLKVAVDCANGSAFEVAKRVFDALNIDAIFSATTPDGININDRVGSTHLENISEMTVTNDCDIGIAYDGDADRCIAVDENGMEIDGDKIISILAKQMKTEGRLSNNTAVFTVMTNLGTLQYCKDNDIDTVTTAVGDRYVLEEMLRKGYSIGGEQSGHVIILENATTGDGILTSLKFIDCLKKSKQKASNLVAEIPIYPQVLRMIEANTAQKKYFNENKEVKDYLELMKDDFSKSGRILVRSSGTEPVIRVLVEGMNQEEVEEIVESICNRLIEMLSEVR